MMLLQKLQNLNEHNSKFIGILALSLIYLILFSWLFYTTNGMPYVMDNNETYSSIIHAKSIENFGISQSKGLADEVFSPHIAAHPYVHSHQGNYPRLYAWLIYKLGATTPAYQIVITTFTVGFAALLFAFGFFSRIANPCFSFIFCLVLLSDYIFFLQWQIVTYRVWYTFVFFLQFFAIEQYLKNKNIRWAFLIFCNTALFCYGELIFAAFLGLFSFFWVTLRCWCNKRQFFSVCFCLIAGLFVAIFALVSQGISYLGAENFLRDIQLTFMSRNNFDSGSLTMAEISKFYREHNVVFWENLMSRSQFISVKSFAQSIFSNFIQVYGPLLPIFFGILFLNFIVSPIFPRLYQIAADKFIALRSNSSTFIIVSQYSFTSLTIAILLKSAAAIATYYFGLQFDSWWLPLFATEIVLFSWLITILGSYAVLHFNLISLLAVAISKLLPHLINNGFMPYWVDIYNINLTQSLFAFLPLIFVVCSLSSYMSRMNNAISNSVINNLTPIPKVFEFIFVGLLAYTIVYFLSPGYVFSGYVVRYAPFLVFVFNLFIAISFYQLIYFVYSSFLIGSSSVSRLLNNLFKWLALALILLVISIWFGLQYILIQKLPPTHYSVFEKLNSYPYRNSSFIVNTYAAPVTVQTGQWAYMDPNIGNALFIRDKEENRLLGDDRYLWLADKNSNNEYRRPDYFICLVGQDIGTALRKITEKGNYKGCFDFPLVKLALKSKYSNQELRLVEYDKLGEQQSGVVSWAIVKFNWGGRLGNGLEWVKPSPISHGK